MNNLQFFLIAINFLVGVSDQFTKELQSQLMPSAGEMPKVVLQNQVLEVKKEVTGNKFNLLDSLSENIDGVCSFDKQSLEAGRAFVFGEVSLCYATSTTTGLASNIEYNTKAPKELQNAKVRITQGNRIVLEMPLRDLHNINTTYKTDNDSEYSQLLGLSHFNDQGKIEINIILPEGVSLDSTTNKHYIWFRAKGLQTAKRVA